MSGHADCLSVVLPIFCESGSWGVVAPAVHCLLSSLLLVARPALWLTFGFPSTPQETQTSQVRPAHL
eukprot:15119351-Alexandrium_andersonii.AAC.1